jgi:hypothetical protein
MPGGWNRVPEKSIAVKSGFVSARPNYFKIELSAGGFAERGGLAGKNSP